MDAQRARFEDADEAGDDDGGEEGEAAAQQGEEEQAAAAEEGEAAEEEEGAGQPGGEVYCVCQVADEPGAPRDYVQCDKCEQWLHPECVDTTLQVRA